MVKDEADVVEYTIRHLFSHVDQILVADNLSTDGTLDILLELEEETAGQVSVGVDDDPAYYQSRKISALAARALELGHDWVLPCDADEIWYTWNKTPIRELLASAPIAGAAMVTAELFNHIPTGLDDRWLLNPVERIGWRIREPGALPKVCCRTRPGLVIHQGNHGADLEPGAKVVDGLVVRHFPWRSEEQYLRKIRNGERAYAATDLPEDMGEHWRAFEGKPDEAVLDHYRAWFYSADPESDDALIYDPAPIS